MSIGTITIPSSQHPYRDNSRVRQLIVQQLSLGNRPLKGFYDDRNSAPGPCRDRPDLVEQRNEQLGVTNEIA